MSDRINVLARLADAVVIGPVVFGATIAALTYLEYGFMVGLGWDPVQSSDVPWPSALALGPYGWLQVANFVFNFVFFGLTLIAFSLGLHRGVRTSGRGSKVGPALMIVAGVAMVLLGFKTDPSESAVNQTWHGLIHSLAFLLLVLSLLPAPFFV